MFFPYLADVVMYRWPIANWVIIALNLLVFILTGFGLSDDSPLWLSRHDFHVPQLLTSAFAHIGFVHLIGNMLFLFVFGNAVNAKLGHWQYCLAYLGAALVAGLGWLALGSGLKCCGASGAIMGVVGLFAAYYPRNDVRVAYILFFKNGTFQLSAIWLILIYFLLDLWGMVHGGQVAYAAHIGGLLFGLALGCLFIWYGWVRSEPEEENLLQFVRLWPQLPTHRSRQSSP